MVTDEILAQLVPTIGAVDRSAVTAVLGGSINRSYAITTKSGMRYFLKVNAASAGEMFEAESDGLAELRSADAVRVPQVVSYGVAGGFAFLLLEFLDLVGRPDSAGAQLGRLLARQHARTSGRFGWHRDNTIGTTAQHNSWDEDWVRFYARHRLGYQFDLARERFGASIADRGCTLLERLPSFFESHHPEPSLLHGDLWGGNWGVTPRDEPVIFDPAVYYGDREADIAMTRLFGGFGPKFFAAYDAAWPLDPGFEIRFDLYNLYHVLNHLNLFGGGYLDQAINLIDQLLAQS